MDVLESQHASNKDVANIFCEALYGSVKYSYGFFKTSYTVVTYSTVYHNSLFRLTRQHDRADSKRCKTCIKRNIIRKDALFVKTSKENVLIRTNESDEIYELTPHGRAFVRVFDNDGISPQPCRLTLVNGVRTSNS